MIAIHSDLIEEIETMIQREVDRRMAELTGEMPPFTVKDAAARLGLAGSTVYGLIRDGKIKTVDTVTDRLVIPASEVDRLLHGSAA